MIKKISAILLALVLCLSVIVVPASAAKAELGDAQMAFSLEWDKDSYKAGETAYLSVYMDAADELSLYTGSFIIGLNSAVFSMDDNAIETVKANSTTSEWFTTYYKEAATNLSWLASTVVPKVQAANTEAENALYDMYLKYTVARNGSGSHENCTNTKDGFHGDEFNPDEPIMTVALVVAADVADGTPVNAAITSGSLTSVPVQTTWKYYSEPGVATKTANIAAADIDVSKTVVTATVGDAVVDSSIVKFGGNQIRFNGIGADGNGVYDKTFDIRTVATIDEADFFALFGADNATDADAAAIEKITAVGFVYTTGEFNDADAKAAAGTGASGAYVDAQVKYIQHTGGAYRFTCLTKGIGETDKDQSMTVLGYIKVGDNVAFFDAAQFVDFTEVYNNGLTNVKAVNPGFNPEA